ncbi:hypothetical protein AB1Y20_015960 [Prymnesium parvum]|uniref:Uncharacterized protein n=1 Tax=Prymnesium parvum TaxID=97485 RepID=A0AB34K1Q5_PRYPA
MERRRRSSSSEARSGGPTRGCVWQASEKPKSNGPVGEAGGHGGGEEGRGGEGGREGGGASGGGGEGEGGEGGGAEGASTRSASMGRRAKSRIGRPTYVSAGRRRSIRRWT